MNYLDRLKSSPKKEKINQGAVMLRVDMEMYDWLNELAHEYRTSVNKVVIEILKDVKNNKEEKS